MNKSGLQRMWQIDAVGLVACLSILGAAYLFGIAPLIEEKALAQAMKQQLNEQRQQVNQIKAFRVDLSKQLSKTRKAVQEAFRLRPIGQLNSYLAQLTELATKSGITLHEIKTGQVKDGGDESYRSISIQMSGEGDYQTCALFLHTLHDGLPDTRLSTLQLTASNSTAKPGARIQLGLEWYARPENSISDN